MATVTIPVINPNIKTMNNSVVGSIVTDMKAVTNPARKPTIKIANPSTRKPPKNPSFFGSIFSAFDLISTLAVFAIK
jgi:hypothetical protein